MKGQAEKLELISQQIDIMSCQREDITIMMAVNEDVIKELAREVRSMKLPAAAPIPVRRFSYPGSGGTVRLFIIDNKPMLLAIDYLGVCGHKGGGANGLAKSGFKRNLEFTVRSLTEIAAMYKVTPAHVQGQASLDGYKSMTFLTPKGMKKVQTRDPEFYDWYTKSVAPCIHELYEIMAD